MLYEDRVYLKHIFDSIELIKGYLIDLNFEEFSDNQMSIDAVVRNLEIIGEAANNVSFNYQKAHPEIPWEEMIGMRNKLIHEYFGIKKDVVWQTCQQNLPELESLLQDLVRV